MIVPSSLSSTTSGNNNPTTAADNNGESARLTCIQRFFSQPAGDLTEVLALLGDIVEQERELALAHSGVAAHGGLP